MAPDAFDPSALGWSLVFPIASTICGIVPDNESNLYVDPQGDYIEDFAMETFPDPPWEADFLEAMAGMLAENYDDIRRNSRLLTVTQGLLVIGVTAAVVAVGIYRIASYYHA